MVTRTTARQVVSRLARGERIAFVDAREDWSASHPGERLAGAVRVRLASIVSDATQVPRGCPIVVYGSDDRDLDVPRVADALRTLGYRQVRILAGGLAEWQLLRYPVQAQAQEPARA